MVPLSISCPCRPSVRTDTQKGMKYPNDRASNLDCGSRKKRPFMHSGIEINWNHLFNTECGSPKSAHHPPPPNERFIHVAWMTPRRGGVKYKWNESWNESWTLKQNTRTRTGGEKAIKIDNPSGGRKAQVVKTTDLVQGEKVCFHKVVRRSSHSGVNNSGRYLEMV